MTRVRVMIALGLLFLCGSVRAGEEGLFPFVVSYDSPANATNVSAWLDRPAGIHGFIRAEDGHLRNDAGPVRFWATNICFEGCFPTHEQAERLAARLARLGINCVRMHHMDNFSIWGDSPNKLTIDPRKLERLDYLIDQLRKHGVYTNLNLHVSRWFGEEEGFSGRDAAARVRQGARQLRAPNDRASEEIRPRPPDACQPVHRQPLHPGTRDRLRRDQQRKRPPRDLGLGPDRSAPRALCRHVSKALERLAQGEVRQHGATPQGLERGSRCPSAQSCCATAISDQPSRAPGTWSATTTRRPTGQSMAEGPEGRPCLRIVVNRRGTVVMASPVQPGRASPSGRTSRTR